VLDHRARVAIHRHIRRAARHGRIVRATHLAAAVARRFNIAESEAEAEIVSQAVLENVALQLGRDLPLRKPAAQPRASPDGAKPRGARRGVTHRM
jgi:hypothetical protein